MLQNGKINNTLFEILVEKLTLSPKLPFALTHLVPGAASVALKILSTRSGAVHKKGNRIPVSSAIHVST